jgi:hypothetical protein
LEVPPGPKQYIDSGELRGLNVAFGLQCEILDHDIALAAEGVEVDALDDLTRTYEFQC